jgi:hypothetical protein
VYRGPIANGQHIGRPVRQPNSGTGGGELHHCLGMVRDRMLHALVRGGHAERSAVVIRSVVQPDAARTGRVHHSSDGRCAVGPEYRLRRLDLDLEAQPAGGEPDGGLEPLCHGCHGHDLINAGDLGQRHDEAGG